MRYRGWPVAAISGLCLLWAQAVRAQIRKNCEEGVSLSLSAGVTSQGTLLIAAVTGAKTSMGITGEWDGKPVPLWTEGERAGTLHGLIGVDLEKAPGKYSWKISWPDAAGKTVLCSIPVTVRPGKFPTEHLKVEKQFVQPDPEQQKRAEEEQKKMRAVYETVTPERYWDGKFRLPLKGVTTGGNFGRRRILNGEARSPHGGVDFPAPSGMAVFASQSGKVVVAEELFYSGNTIVLDHGYGIYTMYAHLSEVEVKPGDKVGAGTEIGKVGATGRVTGPHLHWGLTVERARVNAMEIVQRQP